MIGDKTVIRGKIKADEKLVIYGRVEGTIENTGEVIVGEGGQVRASNPEQSAITGYSVYVSGEVQGTVHTKDLFHLHHSGKLTGEVSSKRIKIDDGATLQGRIEVIR